MSVTIAGQFIYRKIFFILEESGSRKLEAMKASLVFLFFFFLCFLCFFLCRRGERERERETCLISIFNPYSIHIQSNPNPNDDFHFHLILTLALTLTLTFVAPVTLLDVKFILDKETR